MPKEILFKAVGIDKAFGATHALKGIDVDIFRGEIHGLIGENGSGKSTFSSIAAGVQKYDKGQFFLNEKPYNPDSVLTASSEGVSMIIQELGTIGGITVAADIFLGREDKFCKFGLINVTKLYQETRELLSSIGVTHIRPDALIDSLSFEDRKLVEIARALYTNPSLFIVDETTTALTINGRNILYNVMKAQKEKNCSVLFISHDIDEIMDLCDRITILKDGEITAVLDKDEFDGDKIRQLMVGRALKDGYYRLDMDSSCSDDVALSIKNVSTRQLHDISLDIHKGEIVGIGGLAESGMHDLGRVAFGLEKPFSGTVSVADGTLISDPHTAVECSVGYMSKNRDKEALMLAGSIRNNICLPSLRELAHKGFVSPKKEKAFVETWTDALSVKMENIDQLCSALSGGNKQKVVLGKWLGKGCDILILDCPTRGIDVGVKAAIYKLIDNLKKDGKAIMIITEELTELIGMCDRVVTVKDGRIMGIHKREEALTESGLITEMI